LVTSDAFRNRGSPQLASAVTAEITQNINSAGTGTVLEGFFTTIVCGLFGMSSPLDDGVSLAAQSQIQVLFTYAH
jgi:hypothetical protein